MHILFSFVVVVVVVLADASSFASSVRVCDHRHRFILQSYGAYLLYPCSLKAHVLFFLLAFHAFFSFFFLLTCASFTWRSYRTFRGFFTVLFSSFLVLILLLVPVFIPKKKIVKLHHKTFLFDIFLEFTHVIILACICMMRLQGTAHIPDSCYSTYAV